MTRHIFTDLKDTMRFHIATKHTPQNCGFANPDKGIPQAPDWADRYKEMGITYVAGGGCQPEQKGFMFVETDGMTKLRDLLQPVMGRMEIEVTPVDSR